MTRSHKFFIATITANSLILLMAPSAFSEINNIQVSNLTSASATISWTTTDTADGCVHYGLTTSLGDTTCDTRPDDDIHFVEISGLSTDTTYYFEVASGVEVDDNGGSYYTFRTAKVGIGIPYIIYGQVVLPEEVVVSAVVKSSGNLSYLLAELTDSNGVWFLNLGNLKDPGTNDVFPYLLGDSIFITAQVAAEDELFDTTTVSGESPQDCGTLPSTSFIRADAKTDMSVEMSDAIFTLKYLYVPGSDTLTCKDSGDSDDDGSVQMSDAIYTLKYLYVPGSPPPPAPGPTNCGADPTPDGLDCVTHPCFGGK